jgi:hypothetical protein
MDSHSFCGRALVEATRRTSSGTIMSPPKVIAGPTLTSGAGHGNAGAHTVGMPCASPISNQVTSKMPTAGSILRRTRERGSLTCMAPYWQRRHGTAPRRHLMEILIRAIRNQNASGTSRHASAVLAHEATASQSAALPETWTHRAQARGHDARRAIGAGHIALI